MIGPDLLAIAQDWIEGDPSPTDRAELQALIDGGDVSDLASRFANALEFGNAGIRGPLVAGPSGMNLAVIRRLSAAVGTWVQGRGGTRVVVGYDARHRSAEFALDAAGVVTGLGLEVLLADRPWPTPCTAYRDRLPAPQRIPLQRRHLLLSNPQGCRSAWALPRVIQTWTRQSLGGSLVSLRRCRCPPRYQRLEVLDNRLQSRSQKVRHARCSRSLGGMPLDQ